MYYFKSTLDMNQVSNVNYHTFQIATCYTFRDINLILVWIFATDRQTDRQTDRRTQSDAYEPTVQDAQVGSNTLHSMGSAFMLE